MSIKVTVPWQIRLPAVKSGSPHSRNWWNRQHFNRNASSAPLRSVTMKEDDLDHLGAKHQEVASLGRPHRLFGRFFSSHE
jgi:hypothetical protein